MPFIFKLRMTRSASNFALNGDWSGLITTYLENERHQRNATCMCAMKGMDNQVYAIMAHLVVHTTYPFISSTRADLKPIHTQYPCTPAPVHIWYPCIPGTRAYLVPVLTWYPCIPGTRAYLVPVHEAARVEQVRFVLVSRPEPDVIHQRRDVVDVTRHDDVTRFSATSQSRHVTHATEENQRIWSFSLLFKQFRSGDRRFLPV